MPTKQKFLLSTKRKLSKSEIKRDNKAIAHTQTDNTARHLQVVDCIILLPRPQELYVEHLAYVLKLRKQQHILQVKTNGAIVRRPPQFCYCMSRKPSPLKPLPQGKNFGHYQNLNFLNDTQRQRTTLLLYYHPKFSRFSHLGRRKSTRITH